MADFIDFLCDISHKDNPNSKQYFDDFVKINDAKELQKYLEKAGYEADIEYCEKFVSEKHKSHLEARGETVKGSSGY